ncbi:nuclear transport factor 2 family protein [Pseudoduganella namucuonensis]|uniref:Steroid delta-isomerase n=1 Tax=Pseudoduganella namucuonensis TaxID=1035707 RepID=A0A1I7LSF4_9BURK|nr:nuclear transport factor 2 family protein [Pseudoduganella namucuonensis]SFV12500.1 steroid delta-isomerase [Pseudoduganella namucuonensis]
MHTTPSPAEIQAAVRRYAQCLTNGDLDGIVALFAPDAVFEDPIGTVPHVGSEGVRGFFQAALSQTGGRILFEQEGAVRIRGPHAVCAFIATCDRLTPVLVTETTDIFKFDRNGRIKSLVAIWGESNARTV